MLFKKQKPIILATHDESFHADDVFATATLALALEAQKKSFEIIRTRDKGLLQKADYVYDIGRVYDHSVKRYDHHQTGNAGERENSIKYAAFGLIWKHYGLELCNQNQQAWKIIDESWVQPIDAADNGINTYTQGEAGIRPITIQNILHTLSSSEDSDEQFVAAVNFAKKVLKNVITETLKNQIIIQNILEEFELQKDKQIVIFERENISRQLIWSALVENEEAKKVFYTIHKNAKKPGWKVIAMRKSFDSFDSRLPLPKQLGGISSEDLQKQLGFGGVDFVHTSGFLGAAQTKEAAIKLAQYALDMHTGA